MKELAQDAWCAKHRSEQAVGTCERCGAFMCDRCSRLGVEARCVACRPKRTARVHAERRRNAVARSRMVRCLACGYAGRRFDQNRHQPWYKVLSLPFGFVFGLLFGGLGLVLLMSVLSTTQPCPSCGSVDDLAPAPADLQPTPEDEARWRTAKAANRPTRRRNRVLALSVLALGCSVFAYIFIYRF